MFKNLNLTEQFVICFLVGLVIVAFSWFSLDRMHQATQNIPNKPIVLVEEIK